MITDLEAGADFTITQPPALDVSRYSKLAYVAQTQHLWYDIYSMLPDRHLWRYDNYAESPVRIEACSPSLRSAHQSRSGSSNHLARRAQQRQEHRLRPSQVRSSRYPKSHEQLMVDAGAAIRMAVRSKIDGRGGSGPHAQSHRRGAGGLQRRIPAAAAGTSAASDAEQSVEERPVPLKGDAQVFGGDVLATGPLFL